MGERGNPLVEVVNQGSAKTPEAPRWIDRLEQYHLAIDKVQMALQSHSPDFLGLPNPQKLEEPIGGAELEELKEAPDITTNTCRAVIRLAQNAGPETIQQAKELSLNCLRTRSRVLRRGVEVAFFGFALPLTVIKEVTPELALPFYAVLRKSYNESFGTGIFKVIEESGKADMALSQFVKELLEESYQEYLEPGLINNGQINPEAIKGLTNSRDLEWAWGIVPEIGIITSSLPATFDGHPEQLAISFIVLAASRVQPLIRKTLKRLIKKPAVKEGGQSEKVRLAIKDAVDIADGAAILGMAVNLKYPGLGSPIISAGALAGAEKNLAVKKLRTPTDAKIAQGFNSLLVEAIKQREEGKKRSHQVGQVIGGLKSLQFPIEESSSYIAFTLLQQQNQVEKRGKTHLPKDSPFTELSMLANTLVNMGALSTATQMDMIKGIGEFFALKTHLISTSKTSEEVKSVFDLTEVLEKLILDAISLPTLKKIFLARQESSNLTRTLIEQGEEVKQQLSDILTPERAVLQQFVDAGLAKEEGMPPEGKVFDLVKEAKRMLGITDEQMRQLVALKKSSPAEAIEFLRQIQMDNVNHQNEQNKA